MTTQPEGQEPDPFHWKTAISWKSMEKITCRGYDINDLAQNASFTETVFLLFNGDLPTPQQAEMLSHIMVCFMEHSFSPSTVAARMCAAGRPPINAAIAAGILTFGDAHGPGLAHGNQMTDLLNRSKRDGLSLKEAAELFVDEKLESGDKILGVHQPQHTDGDPRAGLILERGKALGLLGTFCELQQHVQDALHARKGTHLKRNLVGSAGPILLDMGFSPSASFSIGVLSRGFGNAAHAAEELERESAWRASRKSGMVDILDLSLQGKENYDGPEDRVVPSVQERSKGQNRS